MTLVNDHLNTCMVTLEKAPERLGESELQYYLSVVVR